MRVNGTYAAAVGGVMQRPLYRGTVVWGAALTLFAFVLLLVLQLDAPFALAGMMMIAGGLVLLLYPELATLVVAFLLYTNIPVLATRHGVPFVLASSFMLLLGIPFLHYVVARREPLRFDSTFALMLVLLGMMLVSSLGAKGPDVAMEYVKSYVLEGLLLYWLVVNAVRNRHTMRRVVLTVVSAGALLGLLTTYQEVTGDLQQQFFGLASRNAEFLALQKLDATDPAVAEALSNAPTTSRSTRANGPMDEPNRYAQVLLVLMPLVLYLGRTTHRRSARYAMAAAGMFIGLGIMFSSSRGAMVSFVLMAALAGYIGWIRRSYLIGGALAALLLIPVLAPQYVARALSIVNITALVDGGSSAKAADGAIRGRVTEMLAAAQAFVDHPVLGVGPGQYTPYYALEYQQKDPRFKFRHLNVARRAHSLYAELPAELGAVGALSFFAIFGFLLRSLNRARIRWRGVHDEYSDLATAFMFSLIAYLCTSVFLHLSYQRYAWFLVALASAAVYVTRDNWNAEPARVS